jgi:hypothetical protein
MAQDVETPRIANATTELDGHDEIEITQEMTDAGVAAYYFSDRRFDTEDEIVNRIYESMRKAINREVA